MATLNKLNIAGTIYDIQDTTSGYITATTANNTYATKAQITNSLYAISKSTSSGTSITITVPGHANAAYDRIMI